MIDAFDEFPVAPQLDRVEFVGAFVQHGDLPLELRCTTVKLIAGGVLMVSSGSGSTKEKFRAPASTSKWVMWRSHREQAAVQAD